jgi:sporulation protein YlmC with PRC-barrel domain
MQLLMKKPFSVILLCSMLIVASADARSKNGEKSAPGDSPVGVQKMQAGAWRGTQLIGMNVYDPDGNRVGAIADIVGDVKGQVVYLILSHGGVLGIGDKLIPLPWELVAPASAPGTLTVQLSKESLERAPNFDPNNWPDFNRSDWKTKTQEYYQALHTKKEEKLK